MKTAPLVSIIVANYNGRDFITSCLESLRQLKHPSFEVIVVDDASTDDSVKIVEERFPEVTLVRLPENHGLAGANNAGLKRARGEILVFDLNNDEVVDDLWLTNLVDVLLSSPEIGITCGKRYQADKDFRRGEIILSAGSRMSYVTAECAANGYGDRDSAALNTQKETDFATIQAIRREVLEKIGSFDSVYGNYYEDADISIRVKQAGYKIVYVPKARSWHIGASSFGKSSYRRYYLLRRNQIRFIIKNFPQKSLILGLAHCLILKTIIDTSFIVPPISWGMKLLSRLKSSKPLIYVPKSGNLDILKAQKQAIAWNLKNLRQTIRARQHSKSLILKAQSSKSKPKSKFGSV